MPELHHNNNNNNINNKVFGELAVLYNCRRTADIRAATDCAVWALERAVFQQLMVTSGMRRMEDR